jgi:hypothetical protein
MIEYERGLKQRYISESTSHCVATRCQKGQLASTAVLTPSHAYRIYLLDYCQTIIYRIDTHSVPFIV